MSITTIKLKPDVNYRIVLCQTSHGRRYTRLIDESKESVQSITERRWASQRFTGFSSIEDYLFVAEPFESLTNAEELGDPVIEANGHWFFPNGEDVLPMLMDA